MDFFPGQLLVGWAMIAAAAVGSMWQAAFPEQRLRVLKKVRKDLLAEQPNIPLT